MRVADWTNDHIAGIVRIPPFTYNPRRMINVLIGPANSGKMETLLARVVDAIAARQRGAHLIVPTLPAASLFRELLTERVEYLPLDVVKTFPALYYTILDKTNTPRQPMNLIERDRVLRFVIAELAQAGQLRYFGETAEMPGLINALGSFIEELWRSHTSPEMFSRVAAARRDKDRDIARVFTRYAEALESLRASDAESAGPAALSAIEQASEPHRWLSLIAVEGFDFLTALQVRLLTALAARGVEVLVSLTYDEARAIHYWQRPTIARLRAAGANFIPYETKPHNAIQAAATSLMTERETMPSGSGSLKNQTPNGEIKIVSAPDRAAEVRSVAREIKRLAVEQRIPLNETTIVCRSLSQYANHLERIFDECAIPLIIDTRLAVMENPAVAAVLRLFGLSHQSFSRRAVLQALRSPYFNWAEFGLGEKSIDLLDTISLVGNVIKGRDQWRQAIKAFVDKPELERMRAEHETPEGQSEEERSAGYVRLSASLDRCFDALTPSVRATPLPGLRS